VTAAGIADEATGGGSASAASVQFGRSAVDSVISGSVGGVGEAIDDGASVVSEVSRVSDDAGVLTDVSGGGALATGSIGDSALSGGVAASGVVAVRTRDRTRDFST
jgi:hypothetical protein